MTISTRDFGKMDIDENSVLEFKLPILGFDEFRQFVILYDDEIGDSFAWLQSIDSSDVCFIIIDPMRFIPDYAPALPEEMLAKIGSSANGAALRCLMVVRTGIEDATVNLKSPIIINPAKKLAGQIVLDEDYPVRAALAQL